MQTKFSQIISQVPEADQAIVALMANRELNMVGGMRPSDAARSAVRAYLADPVAFRQSYEATR